MNFLEFMDFFEIRTKNIDADLKTRLFKLSEFLYSVGEISVSRKKELQGLTDENKIKSELKGIDHFIQDKIQFFNSLLMR